MSPSLMLMTISSGAWLIRVDRALNVDLNSGWDYWPVMGEQVEELRRRYNILPVEAFKPVEREAVQTPA